MVKMFNIRYPIQSHILFELYDVRFTYIAVKRASAATRHHERNKSERTFFSTKRPNFFEVLPR